MAWGAFEPVSPQRWRLSRAKDRRLRADCEVFASEKLLQAAAEDGSLGQVCNVGSLPGLVGPSLAMPDIHHGYGFCIGGVAAFAADGGIVLPGGVGYDINCGVRLLATSIPATELARTAESIGYAVLQRIPTGLTDRALHRLERKPFEKLVRRGAAEVVARFGGRESDLAFIESGGRLEFEAPEAVSRKAWERGANQVGSLGSGNHFIELQEVEEICDQEAAAVFGLAPGTLAVMIHTGSRGFGHQIATDAIEELRRKNLARLGGNDPQLVFADIASAEGRRYLQALNAASNFAWANRHLIQEELIAILEAVFRQGRDALGLRLVYDQAHNIAKFETHPVCDGPRNLLVHRKGATRAFGPGHPEIPAAYRSIGQPVIIPGSMGSPSHVLRGTPQAMALTFGSSAHGAGRRLSRHQAVKLAERLDVRAEMRKRNVLVCSLSARGLKEEIPEAYKEIDEVVAVTEAAGISSRVARLVPRLVVKG